MKFVSFRAGRAAHYGVVDGSKVVDLTPRLKHADLKTLIAADAFKDAAREAKGATADFNLEQITFDPVIVNAAKVIAEDSFVAICVRQKLGEGDIALRQFVEGAAHQIRLASRQGEQPLRIGGIPQRRAVAPV